MRATLFLVHGSHPAFAVKRALELKGIQTKVVEYPPPMHAAVQPLLFNGARTVPTLKLEGGEKVVGSRTIFKRLDELAPEPPMYPADPAARAKVEEADRWGDEHLQALTRRVLWPTFKNTGGRSMPSYLAGSKLPPIPAPVLRAMAPGMTRIEMRMNQATDATYPSDVRAVPAAAEHVAGLLADGTIGGAVPNAADLQIASSIRLLGTLEDLVPALEQGGVLDFAKRVFPQWDGHTPKGAIPADLLRVPEPATAP